MMKASKRGLVEIASHEGIVNTPYKDSVGVWTVGIGHTASAGAPDPSKVRGEYTIPEIMGIFALDIAKFEKRVNAAFTRPLTQEQFDAALSFDFNTGAINRATWVKRFNAGEIGGAKKSFMDWRKPKEIIPRRAKERDLFFDGKYSSNGSATMYPATEAGRVLWNRGQRVDVIAILAAKKAPPAPASPSPAPTGVYDDNVLLTCYKPAAPAPDPSKAGFWASLFAILLRLFKKG